MLRPTPEVIVSSEEDVAGLVSLCAAYADTIECLRAALDEHREAVGDQRRIRRLLAHELRTPLNSIMGTIETLLMTELPQETISSLLRIALRQVIQLDETVDDILLMSDARDLWTQRAPSQRVTLREIVDDACHSMMTHIRPGSLDLDIPEDLVIETVPSRLRQILVNLLSNAVQFGPEDGKIAVVSYRHGKDVRVEVSDHGPGLDADDQPALFTPYSEGVALMPSEPDSPVGLGLFVVAGLASSLGGEIDLLPREGGGTIARLTIPQRRDTDPDDPMSSIP